MLREAHGQWSRPPGPRYAFLHAEPDLNGAFLSFFANRGCHERETERMARHLGILDSFKNHHWEISK